MLPAAVPLSALADATRDAVNRILRTRGDDELPRGSYEFARAAGMTALAAELSLAAQGVADGELLALGSRQAPRSAYAQHRKRLHRAGALGQGAVPGGARPATRSTVARDADRVALTVAAVIVWRMRWAGDGTLGAGRGVRRDRVVLLIAAVIGAGCAPARTHRGGRRGAGGRGPGWPGARRGAGRGDRPARRAHPGRRTPSSPPWSRSSGR